LKVLRIAVGVALVILVAALAYGLIRNSAIIERFPKHEMVMRSIVAALQVYKIEFGEYPKGENRLMTKTLMGENSKRTVFLEISIDSTNAEGELIDPWGTPYNILASTETGITVRSAGPNRRFDDEPKSDDIVRSGR
jgi:type II secretory pathway pseudopilin PulG